MSLSDDINMQAEALLRVSQKHKEKNAEIQRRVAAGELPRFEPTLAADPNKETCHWETVYLTDDKSTFDTACGHLAVWGGKPMLGGSRCGYCNRKIVCCEDYIKAWKTAHQGYEWKDD